MKLVVNKGDFTASTSEAQGEGRARKNVPIMSSMNARFTHTLFCCWTICTRHQSEEEGLTI